MRRTEHEYMTLHKSTLIFDQGGDAPVDIQEQLLSCQAAMEKLVHSVGSYSDFADDKMPRKMNTETVRVAYGIKRYSKRISAANCKTVSITIEQFI